jgi:hypothetical protein
MPWGRVDDTFYDHDKVLNLPVEVRNRACGLYWRAISYSNAKLTDGRLTPAIVALLDGCDADAEALVRARLWRRTRSGGYSIHDFAEFNKTRAEVLVERQKKVDAGRSGGLASGRARAKQKASENEAGASPVLEADAKQKGTPVPTRPDPSVLPEKRTPPPPTRGGRRKDATNPRALGESPRQEGEDPRSNGSSIRQERDAQKRGPTSLREIVARLQAAVAPPEPMAPVAEPPADAPAENWFEETTHA